MQSCVVCFLQNWISDNTVVQVGNIWIMFLLIVLKLFYAQRMSELCDKKSIAAPYLSSDSRLHLSPTSTSKKLFFNFCKYEISPVLV